MELNWKIPDVDVVLVLIDQFWKLNNLDVLQNSSTSMSFQMQMEQTLCLCLSWLLISRFLQTWDILEADWVSSRINKRTPSSAHLPRANKMHLLSRSNNAD